MINTSAAFVMALAASCASEAFCSTNWGSLSGTRCFTVTSMPARYELYAITCTENKSQLPFRITLGISPSPCRSGPSAEGTPLRCFCVLTQSVHVGYLCRLAYHVNIWESAVSAQLCLTCSLTTMSQLLEAAGDQTWPAALPFHAAVLGHGESAYASWQIAVTANSEALVLLAFLLWPTIDLQR